MERYVWAFDRAANVAEVFDGATGAYAGTVNLVSRYSADPTPDLPGASLVIRLDNAGVTGEVRGLVPITNRDVAGVERADAHAIRVRRL